MLGLRESDLAAVGVPPGPAWIDVVAEAWEAGAAILPLDHRLPRHEVERMVSAARPTIVLDRSGITRLRSGLPVNREVGLVVATSGTAGRPKLAELTRGALLAAVEASAARLVASAADRWLCCLPLAHMGGMLLLLRSLLLDAPVTVHPGFDPSAFERGRSAGATFTSVVPAMLARLLDAGVDLGGFRAILVGGASLPEELAARAGQAGASIIRTYGLTESCGGVVYEGIPLGGVEVRIAGGAGPRDGDVEEVLLRGSMVFRGYRLDPEATEGAYVTGGWLRTGDAGALVDGRLQISGRLDDLIVTGGEKVWPEEVEALLRRDPAVLEVAVAGRVDPVWGARVIAYVVPTDPSSPPSLGRLRSLVEERLAPHKAPRELVLVDALPMTSTEKVRRRAL